MDIVCSICHLLWNASKFTNKSKPYICPVCERKNEIEKSKARQVKRNLAKNQNSRKCNDITKKPKDKPLKRDYRREKQNAI